MVRFYNLGRVIELNKENNTYKVGSLSHQHKLSYFEYLYWKNINKYENHEDYILLLEKKLNKTKRKIDFEVKEIHQKLINLHLISEMNLSLEDDLSSKIYVKSLFNDFALENENYYVTIDNKRYRLNNSFITTMTAHPFTIKELTYIHSGLKNIKLEESFAYIIAEIKETLINDLVTVEYFDKEYLKKEIPSINFDGINFKKDRTKKSKKEDKKNAEILYYIGGASIYKNKSVEKELIYLDGEFKTTTELEYVLSEGMKSKSIKKESLINILENSLNLNKKVIDSTLNKIIDKGILVPILNTTDISENKSLFLEYGILPKGQIVESKSIYLSNGENKKLSDDELLIYMNSYPELTVFETAILIQKEKNIAMDDLIYEFFYALNSLLNKEIITLVKIGKN